MKTLIVMLVLDLFLLQDSDAAHPVVERACESRKNASFDSLHFRVSVVRDAIAPSDPLAEIMNESRVDYEFWISEDIERVDCEESRPLDPRNGTTTRFSRNGNVRRLVPSLENEMILTESEVPSEDNASFLGAISTVSIDPLQVGFWPAPFGALDQFDFSDLKRMFQGNDFTTVSDRTLADGTTVVRGEIDGGSPFWWTIAFPLNSEVPSEIVFYGRAGPHVRERLRCDWVSVAGLPLPKSANYTRESKGGSVLWEETWTFDDHSVNEPIPSKLTTWESLGIWEGAAVEFVSNGSTEIKQYRNGSFQEWNPVPVFEEPVANIQPRSSRRWLVVGNALVLGCLLLFFGLRQLRRL